MGSSAIVPSSHWLSLGRSQPYAESMMGLQRSLIKRTMELELLEQSMRTLRQARLVLDLLQKSAPFGCAIFQKRDRGWGEAIHDIRVRTAAILEDTLAEKEIVIRQTGSLSDLPSGLLLHDDSLLPLWKRFADVLRSLATYKHPFNLHLMIANVQIPNKVLDMLAPVLEGIPLNDLVLVNNGLGREGMEFVARLLEKNPAIKALLIRKNEVECERAVLSLARTASKHPLLKTIRFVECGIGRKSSIVREILPPLLAMERVNLRKNGIGSRGAALISACLAANPGLDRLLLDGNLFDDDDATLFANALGTNTNLTRLSLCDSNFTDEGIKILLRSVYDDQSLNAIYHSNATCQLKLFPDDAQAPSGMDLSVLSLNGTVIDRKPFPVSNVVRCARASNFCLALAKEMLKTEGRRKMKVLHALQGASPGRFNMQYLGNLSLEIMPKVVAFFHETGKYAAQERKLDVVFQVIRSRPEVTVASGVGKRKLRLTEVARTIIKRSIDSVLQTEVNVSLGPV